MSGAGFHVHVHVHVHGPHDHELEHAAQGGHADSQEGGGMIAQIAVITAIIATVGAIFSYMGGATQANAGLFKNNAAIKKTEAESAVWDKSSDQQMHQRHRWAQATTVLQVSIALAAIALLTRKKWLEYGMFALAGVGVAISALAILHI